MDIGPGKILKHQDDDYDLSAVDGRYAYLKPYSFISASGYLDELPYFDLYLEVGADTEDEFMCMKSSKYHSNY